MTRRLIRTMLSTLSLMLVCAGAFGYGDTVSYGDFSYMTLKGIRTLAVEFTGLYPDYRRYGLEEAALRTAVERRLRTAGLQVVSRDEAVRLPGAALLRIETHANLVEYRYYSYAVSLKLKQKIPLPADPESFISETIWSTGATGIAEEYRLDKLNGEIDTLVEAFLKEHAAQNPAR